MAQFIRPLSLRLWPRLHHRCCSNATLNHLVSSPSPPSLASSRRRSFATAALSPNGPRQPRIAYGTTVPEEFPGGFGDSPSDSDSDGRPSRNQKKREARRAVRWGMELASLTNPQIRRILSAASIDSEVYEAIMLVKRMKPNVREGRRRQFNFIGKLLRDADPELMDGLIQATKDGEISKLQELAGSVIQITENEDEDDVEEEEEEEEEDEDSEEEEEESPEYIRVATRWFDGLVSKDIEVTNEVYSLRSVEFDRQELRRLIRRVHSVQEQQGAGTEENKQQLDVAMATAKNPLLRFLRRLAKQMPVDEFEG